MKKQQNLLSLLIVGAVFVVMVLGAWLAPVKDFSDSERRKLAQRPELSVSSLVSGRFMTDFEKFSQDQFPLRQRFRTLKAISAYELFGRLDNNGIYVQDGYAAQLVYPLQEESVAHAVRRFAYIYEKYLTDAKVYLSVVPDKGYYLAQDSGHLRMDYDRLFSLMQEGMPFAEYIDITGALQLSDYYKTDTHWRQEKITDVATLLATAMGGSALGGNYTENVLDRPFYGVYCGQSALPLPAEPIVYLTNPILDSLVVTNHEDGTVGGAYDLKKAAGKDPYELFLSGSLPLVTIENPNADTERELLLFRDSFASSLAPLLAQEYSKITLIDIRYLRADYLDKFVNFHGQDVLFLYSTLLLNSSSTLT